MVQLHHLCVIYLLSMDRMKNFKDEVDRLVWEYIAELEEENIKLKWLLKEHVTTYDVHFDELIEENKKLKERIKELEEQRIFSLWEYDYMILTSTTPQLKLTKKVNSDLCSNITVWTTQK